MSGIHNGHERFSHGIIPEPRTRRKKYGAALRFLIFLTIGTTVVPNNRVLSADGPSKAETIIFLKRLMQDGTIVGLSNSRRTARIDDISISAADGRVSIEFRFEGGGRVANPGNLLFKMQELSFTDGSMYEPNIRCKVAKCIGVTVGSNYKEFANVYIGTSSDEDDHRLRRALYHLASFFSSNPRDDYFR